MRKLLFLILIIAASAYVLPGVYSARQLANLHYAKATQMIAAAKDDRRTSLSFKELTHLRQLPPSITELEGLNHLNLRGTEIASLEVVSQLDDLQWLSIRETQVSDLTPLTRLKNLNSLDIGKSRVQDLEPLTQVRFLAWLDIGNTEIRTLEPLTRVQFLNWVNLHGSYAHDGSRQHFDELHKFVPEVYNGSAFRQNYVPGQLYLLKTRLGRLANDLYLAPLFSNS